MASTPPGCILEIVAWTVKCDQRIGDPCEVVIGASDINAICETQERESDSADVHQRVDSFASFDIISPKQVRSESRVNLQLHDAFVWIGGVGWWLVVGMRTNGRGNHLYLYLFSSGAARNM